MGETKYLPGRAALALTLPLRPTSRVLVPLALASARKHGSYTISLAFLRRLWHSELTAVAAWHYGRKDTDESTDNGTASNGTGKV